MLSSNTMKMMLKKFEKCDNDSRNHLLCCATDATQPYDQESKLSSQIPKSKTLVRQGHTVLAHSHADYSSRAAALGVAYYPNADDLCEEHPEVILLCTSILSTDKVLKSLPLQCLKRSTLFVDVLSVKEFAKDVFLQILPKDFDILCTHPMFDPESGKDSWKDLTFVYDKVRIGNEESRVARCENFLKCFEREGCLMREMTCAEHDMHAAESQFITHTVGRILEKFGLDSTPINTKGYESLLDLVDDNTVRDKFGAVQWVVYGLLKLPHNGNGTSVPAESYSISTIEAEQNFCCSEQLCDVMYG
ncbi:arogenate dehydrogenase 2, chloroplastic-like protein [Tanacetum coccineum]